MIYYLAFVFRERGGFGFTVPDVEGFTALAETDDFGEAVAVARRTLASHLASLIDAGGTLPAARSI